MLFSVVDDRSGAAYQEYRCVYGEDVEAALRFLFNAMSPKPDGGPFQGIPSTIYLDNGPVIDCCMTVAGVLYEVDAELAGETVVVWWGLFDQELWVERGEERWGPYHPVGGPVPLHRYRKHRRSRREARADKVGELAAKMSLPRSALSGEDDVVVVGAHAPGAAGPVPVRPFVDPDPFHELTFPTPLAARHAIADELRLPLAKLGDEDRAFIDRLLAETLSRPVIIAAVRERFPAGRKGGIG